MNLNYESIKDFIKRANTSRTTIHRFYKKYPDLLGETIKKKIRRYIPIIHARYFNRETLIEEVRLMEMKNNSMKNIIDHLMDRDSFQTQLWEMGWSFFGTISYASDLNTKTCYNLMTSMFKKLEKNYSEVTDIRIFFTTEPFKLRDGHHNHFVLYVSNPKFKEDIIQDIWDYFSHDRVDIMPYDKYQAGLFYMTKKGLHGDDWDILYSSLEEIQIKEAS